MCHFLRLLQSFQSLVTSSCSCSIWTLYSLRQPSRSRLGPTKTQCAGSSAKICVQSSLAFSKGRIAAELEEARAEYTGWLCSLGRKSGCSTTRKRMSNPGTAWDTCTPRHCKDEKLDKKLCVVGEPGCRPGNQSANLYQVSSRPQELVLCPDPLTRVRKRVLVFWSWATFLVTWGTVALRSESSNQILERIIICAWHKRSYFEPNWR